MKCAAEKLEVDLMRDQSVRLTLRCKTSYEAAVLYDDLTETARSGTLIIDFGGVSVARGK